jgi:tetratricopeptide (TPR) repeat protein
VTHEKLRLLIGAAREKEASALVPYVDDSTPSDSGHWSAKDNLAHLAAWRLLAAEEIDAVRTGLGSASIAEETQEQHNARAYEAARHEPAAAVREAAIRSWDRLAAAADACSEEDLVKPRLRRPEQKLWQMIPGNTYFHIAQHLGWWNTERSDDVAAEDAAKWAHDLATTLFPEGRARGYADYNLGCFYAARGRAEKAIPYLRSGLELNPVLREWAKRDSDLDAIRSSTELAHLLADPA